MAINEDLLLLSLFRFSRVINGYAVGLNQKCWVVRIDSGLIDDIFRHYVANNKAKWVSN